jgi:ribosome-associated protein
VPFYDLPLSSGRVKRHHADMIRVTETLLIPESEIRERFIRSSGPGGQNINKVATAVQLRFDVRASPFLPDAVRERLVRLAGRRMTGEGVLIIEARRFRTRERNREDARDRLAGLIRKATEPARLRRETRPTRKSRERRLCSKHQRSRVKQARKAVPSSED